MLRYQSFSVLFQHYQSVHIAYRVVLPFTATATAFIIATQMLSSVEIRQAWSFGSAFCC